ncbi:hypothetical protein NYE33_20445 [Paenibacillus sp. FSL R10-2199]|uniref:hypothetical protein n=1 Tax=Paenibacillus sp. FSL R10-2199 TaxID=2975348 RepID=UPI0030FB20C4
MNETIEDFVEMLINWTKDKKANWEKVNPLQYSRLLGRSISNGKIVDAYYFKKKNSNDIAVVGRMEIRVYTDADEYYLEDDFFIVETDSTFNEPVAHFDKDEEISDFSFGLNLSRLYRLIKLSRKKTSGSYSDWL